MKIDIEIRPRLDERSKARPASQTSPAAPVPRLLCQVDPSLTDTNVGVSRSNETRHHPRRIDARSRERMEFVRRT